MPFLMRRRALRTQPRLPRALRACAPPSHACRLPPRRLAECDAQRERGVCAYLKTRRRARDLRLPRWRDDAARCLMARRFATRRGAIAARHSSCDHGHAAARSAGAGDCCIDTRSALRAASVTPARERCASTRCAERRQRRAVPARAMPCRQRAAPPTQQRLLMLRAYLLLFMPRFFFADARAVFRAPLPMFPAAAGLFRHATIRCRR